MVGARSSANLLIFGRPRLIFFHAIGISHMSQNNLIAFTKLRRVADVISSLSTLSRWNCMNFNIQWNAQLGSFNPFEANWLHLCFIVPLGNRSI